MLQLSIKKYSILEVAGQTKIILKYAQRLRVCKLLYRSKLLFKGGEPQEVNALAQKSDVKVVKERLGRLDKDVILKKDVDKNS